MAGKKGVVVLQEHHTPVIHVQMLPSLPLPWPWPPLFPQSMSIKPCLLTHAEDVRVRSPRYTERNTTCPSANTYRKYTLQLLGGIYCVGGLGCSCSGVSTGAQYTEGLPYIHCPYYFLTLSRSHHGWSIQGVGDQGWACTYLSCRQVRRITARRRVRLFSGTNSRWAHPGVLGWIPGFVLVSSPRGPSRRRGSRCCNRPHLPWKDCKTGRCTELSTEPSVQIFQSLR